MDTTGRNTLLYPDAFKTVGIYVIQSDNAQTNMVGTTVVESQFGWPDILKFSSSLNGRKHSSSETWIAHFGDGLRRRRFPLWKRSYRRRIRLRRICLTANEPLANSSAANSCNKFFGGESSTANSTTTNPALANSSTAASIAAMSIAAILQQQQQFGYGQDFYILFQAPVSSFPVSKKY